MPEWIVGGCEYVVVHLIVIQILAVADVAVGIFGVGKMNRHQGIGADFPHSPGTCADELHDSFPAAQFTAVLAAHGTVGLIANLHHTHIHTGIHQFLQGFFCVLIQGFGLLVNIHSLPCLRCHLLAGVCPEVGIMEIHQQLHARRRCPLANGNGIFNIAVAAAVAVARCVEGIVPDADTDVVDAVFTEDLIDILFGAFVVIVLHAALFQRGHAGGIHAHDEILR